MAEYSLTDLSKSGIYQIVNLVNGKRYVGSAKIIKNRWRTHLFHLRHERHHSKYLQRSWGKYGEKSFSFEILEFCSIDSLIKREQAWLDRLSPEFNSSPTAGSCLGVKHSEETRRRRSELNLGNKFCVGRVPSAKCIAAVARANQRRKGEKRRPDAVERTASAHRGMKRSDETRRNISKARMGVKLRRPRSEEYRRKISEAHKGKQKSPEHMAALQAGRAATVYTEERKEKLAETVRRQYEDGTRSREISETHRANIGRAFAKLSDDQVREIRECLSLGMRNIEISQRYSVPAGTISCIKRGKSYRWVI